MKRWLGVEPALGLFALLIGVPVFLFFAVNVLGLFRSASINFYNDPLSNPFALVWLALLAITGLQALRRRYGKSHVAEDRAD